MAKISKHIKWWRLLSERSKWNITINNLKHWQELSDEEILEYYNKREYLTYK